MADSYNFDVTQNSNFNVNVIARDVNGNYLNLSGYNAVGLVKFRYSDTGYLYNLNPYVDVSYTGGLVVISGNIGTGVPFGKYVYDVGIISSGNSLKILNGFFNINQSISN